MNGGGPYATYVSRHLGEVCKLATDCANSDFWPTHLVFQELRSSLSIQGDNRAKFSSTLRIMYRSPSGLKEISDSAASYD